MADTIRVDEAVEFAENPEPRCPCVLLLDTSKSMRGEAINALNQGLLAFHDDLVKDPLAARRVEVATISFGGDVKVIHDFLPVDAFTPPTLKAGGLTPMGTGILTSLDLLESRKSVYKAHGVPYYRPWIFMITDGKPKGEPDGTIENAIRRLHEAEGGKRVAFFSVAVKGAYIEKLREISVRPPVYLEGLNFVELFVWLSRSTQQVVHSQVPLPPPSPEV
ncbi:MAG: vWA domain-containing protein [Armatimonadota bacterium]